MTGRTGVRPAQPCITLGFVRRIHLHQTRGDCVTIDVRADLERMAAWAAALVVMASLNVWLGAPLWLLALDAVVLPVIVIGLRRAATRRHRTLVRAQGRLLLDGEPLEMARVELRVRNWPLTKVPRGYSLSLWVMTASGPEDLPVGHFVTMLDATARSGLLEDFVQRDSAQRHRPLTLN